jgi:hypothetical protein
MGDFGCIVDCDCGGYEIFGWMSSRGCVRVLLWLVACGAEDRVAGNVPAKKR